MDSAKASVFGSTACRRLTFAGLALTAVGVTGALSASDVETARLFDNLHWIAAHLTAAFLAVMSVRSAPTADRPARLWFAAGLVAYAIAEIFYGWQVLAEWSMFPGPSDAFSLLFGPFSLVGFVIATRALSKGTDHIPVGLDILAGSLAVTGLTLAIYLPHSASFNTLQLVVLAAYPITILSAAIAGVVYIVHARPKLAGSPLLFLISLVVIGLCWMNWNGQALAGTTVDGSWLNAVFSLGAIGLGFGAAIWRSEESTNVRYWRICAVLIDALPLAMVLGAAISLVAILTATELSGHAAPVIYAAIGVVAVGMMRQSYLLAKNRDLAHRAETDRMASLAADAVAESATPPRIGSWEFDIASQRSVWSGDLRDIYGITDETVEAGETWFALIDARDRDRVRIDMQKALSGAVPSYAALYRIQHPRRGERWISDRGWVERDSAGHALKVHGWSRDVTDRRALESDLAKTNRLLEIALSAGGVGLWEWSPTTNAKVHDSHWLTMMGYGLDSGKRTTLDHWDMVHPEDTDRVSEELNRYLSGETDRYESLHRIRDAKGNWRWMLSRGRIVERDNAGKPILLAGTHQDVTERKQAEDDLKSSQILLDQTVRRYHQFFNNMRNIIICIGNKGSAEGGHGYGERGALLFGRDVDELAGSRRDSDGAAELETWYESIHPDDRPRYMAAERMRKEKGAPFDLSFRVRHPKTGEMRWMREIAWSTDNPRTGEVYLDGYIVDVTKEKETEAALRESEARYQHAERVALLSHWVSKPGPTDSVTDIVLEYSPMAATILGVDIDQVPKTAEDFVTRFVHPEDRAGLIERVKEAHARHVADATYRYRIVRPDGQVRQINAHVKYQYDGSGRLIAGFGSIQDVTALTEAEEALRQSETFYRQAEQAAHLVHWSSKAIGGKSRLARPVFSAGAEQLFGIAAKDLDLTHLDYANTIVHPDDREIVFAALSRVSSDKVDNYELDYRIVRPDKTVRHVHEVVKDFYDDHGMCTHSFGTLIDVTEQRETERALRMNEAQYRRAEQMARLTHWTGTAITPDDYSTARFEFSDGAQQIFGIAIKELNISAAEFARRFIHPDDLERVKMAYPKSAGHTTKSFSVEYRIVRPDGGIRYVRDEGTDSFDDQGRWISCFGTILDVTEQRKAEEALRGALEVAEAASEAKTQFLANTSHELRTPLNAIIGFSEVMSRQMLGPMNSPQYLQYSGDIHSSALHLLGIINDLLDLSRVESGQLKLSEEPLDVGPLVQSCLQFLRRRADSNGIILQANCPASLPQINVDQRAIKQVLLNLLSNAVKFTPAGGTITVAATSAAGGMAISVADSGIGMSPEEIVEVVKPFVQVENWLVRKHEGIGLGLPIAKKLCELHDGELEIESEKGKGTKMTIHLPAYRVLHNPRYAAR